MSLLNYIVPFLVILIILVFVHELGHYWVAKRNGVRIDVFSIGFGRELFGWTDHAGTRWKFSAIPLGGYVKMLGEHDLEEQVDAHAEPGAWMTPEQRAQSFSTKSVAQRSAIVAAGPIANFLFAIVVFAALFIAVGRPHTAPVVTGVLAGSAAERAGFRAGDEVLQLDGSSIDRFQDIQVAVQMRPSVTLEFVVSRDGERVTLTATPELVREPDRLGKEVEQARLGIQGGRLEYIRLGPGVALVAAVDELFSMVGRMLGAIGEIVTGERPFSELGGPIRIAEMTGDVAQVNIVNVIYMAAVLSINLGLINLFPIPMLDGGHLIFYAAEAVRGRPVGARMQEMSFRIGLALVLTLMLAVTINDIVSLPVFDFVRSLVG